jgi:uncharacterized protein
MIDQKTVIQFLQTHLKEFEQNYHIIKIGLIGSFARQEQTENSDIDLLVEFEPGVEDLYDLKMELRQFIKANLYRDVDICREKYVKPYIKEALLKEVIYV